MEKVFTSLSLKEKDFQTFEAASKESIDEYNIIVVEKFDEKHSFTFIAKRFYEI